MNKQIELKATGECMVFTKTAADTGGTYVEMLVTLPASGDGPPPHRHVYQTELFEAIEGRLGLDVDGKKIIVEPGQSYTVPVNIMHRCYSIDGDVIRFKATFTPALNIEYLLTEIFDSCNRKQSKDPSPFDACYVLKQIKGEYYLGDVPMLVQKTVFPVTASIGKWFGLVKAKPKNLYQET